MEHEPLGLLLEKKRREVQLWQNIMESKGLLVVMMEYLTGAKYAGLATINKVWKEASDTPSLWKFFIVKTWPGMEPVVAAMDKRLKEEGDGPGSENADDDDGDDARPAQSFKKFFQRLITEECCGPYRPPNLQECMKGVFLYCEVRPRSHDGRVIGSMTLPLWEPEVVESFMTERAPGVSLNIDPPIAPKQLRRYDMNVKLIDGAEGKVVCQGVCELSEDLGDPWLENNDGLFSNLLSNGYADGHQGICFLDLTVFVYWKALEGSTINDIPSSLSLEVVARLAVDEETVAATERLRAHSAQDVWSNLVPMLMPWKLVKAN